MFSSSLRRSAVLQDSTHEIELHPACLKIKSQRPTNGTSHFVDMIISTLERRGASSIPQNTLSNIERCVHSCTKTKAGSAHLGNLVNALLAAELAQLEALYLGLGCLPPLAHRRAEEALRTATRSLMDGLG